jgi:hypothetical protein
LNNIATNVGPFQVPTAHNRPPGTTQVTNTSAAHHNSVATEQIAVTPYVAVVTAPTGTKTIFTGTMALDNPFHKNHN